MIAAHEDYSMEKPVLLKPVQFAKATNTSKSKVYSMLEKNEIPFCRVGGMIRIPAAVIEKFVQEAMRSASMDDDEPAR